MVCCVKCAAAATSVFWSPCRHPTEVVSAGSPEPLRPPSDLPLIAVPANANNGWTSCQPGTDTGPPRATAKAGIPVSRRASLLRMRQSSRAFDGSAEGLATAAQLMHLGVLPSRQGRSMPWSTTSLHTPQRVNARRLRGGDVRPDKGNAGSGQCSGRMGLPNGTSDQRATSAASDAGKPN